MPGDDSNSDEVMGWLGGFIDSIVMTRKGVEKSLGLDIAEVIVHGSAETPGSGILGRCENEVAPDGSPWSKNSKETLDRKERVYGWAETNRQTGQLLSEVSLLGRTTVEPSVVTLVYGTDEPPGVSAAPTGELSDKDKSVTDVQKATWAHEQGRGFYGIGPGDAENASRIGQAVIDEMIRQANGG